MIPRRQVLKAAAASSVWLLASGHTPYRQWDVYRRKHLLIGADKADPLNYELGKKIVELITVELPAVKARAAHAPHAWRLATLLISDQTQLALLGERDLLGLRDGRDGFEAFGPTPLRALYRFGDYWLVSRPEFPSEHAALVARTLAEHGAALAKRQGFPEAGGPVQTHVGILKSAGNSSGDVRKN